MHVFRYQGIISFKIQHTWQAMYSLATDWPFDLASFLRYLKRWLVNKSLVCNMSGSTSISSSIINRLLLIVWRNQQQRIPTTSNGICDSSAMLFPCRKGGAVPSTESGLTRFMLLLLKLGLPGAGETDLKIDHTNIMRKTKLKYQNDS